MRRLTTLLFVGLCNSGLALVELRSYSHISRYTRASSPIPISVEFSSLTALPFDIL